VWGVAAALGLRATRVSLRLSGPSGERCLLETPRYQYGWQELYWLSEHAGVPFEAGDRVELACTWNNSSSEPIEAGPGATDERCIAQLLTTEP